jgi:cysteine-rich repeat protein
VRIIATIGAVLCSLAGCAEDAKTDFSGLTNGDGGADASQPPLNSDAGTPIEPPSIDGGQVDGGCQCEPVDECHVGVCDPVDGCLQTNAPDGMPCEDMETHLCVAGECVLSGCGDGYREPGPLLPREGCDDGNLDAGDACDAMCSPTVLVVASRMRAFDHSPVVGVDDAGNALVAWLSETTDLDAELILRARRFTPGGVALDSIGEPIELARLPFGYSASPSVAGLESGWVVVWSAPSGPHPQARYRRVLVDGTLSSDRSVSGRADRTERSPRIARSSDGLVMTYLEVESGELMARRFDASARPLALPFSIGAAAENLSIAASGTVWMPLFEDSDRSILARRYDGLEPTDSAFIVATDAADAAATTLQSGDFAVAWTSFVTDLRGDVYARVVRATGEALDLPHLPVAADPALAETARSIAARGGETYVVAFELGTDMGAHIAFLGGAVAPPESSLLSVLEPPGVRGGLVLAPSARGSWLVWHARGPLGDPSAFRSVFAFLLPPE